MAMPSTPLDFRDCRSQLLQFIVRRSHSMIFSILERLELATACLLKRRLVMTFQGDDARQGDTSLNLFSESIAHHVQHGYYGKSSDNFKRRRIKQLNRRGVQMLALNPDLLRVLPKESVFIPYTNVKTDQMVRASYRRSSSRVRIVHAPSHRDAKGTSVILDAVSRLWSLGHDFEFELIENVHHQEARQMMKGAHLLIDQLYAGWYGGVAVEAMATGTAVMCYIRTDDLNYLPPDMVRDMPIINVTADTVAESLREFVLRDESAFVDLAERSVQYVRTWHDPKSIARQALSLYGLN